MFDADDLFNCCNDYQSYRRSSLTCKHGKIFLFSSHKNKIGVSLLLHLISDRNPHIFNCRKICRGGKNLASSYPGVAFATPCHPMATGLLMSQQDSELDKQTSKDQTKEKVG